MHCTAEEDKDNEVVQGEYDAVVSWMKEKKDRVKTIGFQVETLEKKRDLLRMFAQHACHLRTRVCTKHNFSSTCTWSKLLDGELDTRMSDTVVFAVYVLSDKEQSCVI